MPATAQVLDIGGHHGLQRFYAGGQTKASEAGSTACHASAMRGVTASVRDVVVLVMALLSLKESTPGAYGSGQATLLCLFQHRSGHPRQSFA
jgi:hypothetical protein